MRFTRTEKPTKEPITVGDAVKHLQIDYQADSGTITELIGVARGKIEDETGYVLMDSEWLGVTHEWVPDTGANGIELGIAPVTEITSIKYYADGETVLTTVSESLYSLCAGNDRSPALIVLSDDFTFPSLAIRPDAVQITFRAGSVNPVDVPPSLRHAIRLIVRHFHDRREVVSEVKLNEIPMNAQSLMGNYRVCGWVN